VGHDRAVTRPTAVVLVLGGDEAVPGAPTAAELAGALVVAADSGLHAALDLGLRVDHLVGDLDSADPTRVAEAEAAGTTVHRHPADKDATDSELAVALVADLIGPAAASGGHEPAPVRLLVLGGGGGRLDHLLADLLLLASPRLAAFEVTARIGPATVSVVRPGRPRRLVGRVGDQVSLVPVHGGAVGVDTTGLRWALVAADLVPGTTRAVSNELLGAEATVAVGTGVLVVVQPGTTSHVPTTRATPYDPTPLDPDRPT
jgi:thiamine pyrophosphokinase